MAAKVEARNDVGPLNIIVTGSRVWNDKSTIIKSVVEAIRLHFFGNNKVSTADIEDKFRNTTIRAGGAKGADAVAENWARSVGMKVQVFEADWEQHDKAAGPIRNREMVRAKPKANYCLAFYADDHDSRGTQHCVKEARKAGIVTIEISGPVWDDREARMAGIETG